VVGIILATGLYMVVTNCVIMEESTYVDWRAIIILVILLGIKAAYKQIAKKKFSPIILILLSAIVGVVVLSVI
jgi:chromate transporter